MKDMTSAKQRANLHGDILIWLILIIIQQHILFDSGFQTLFTRWETCPTMLGFLHLPLKSKNGRLSDPEITNHIQN